MTRTERMLADAASVMHLARTYRSLPPGGVPGTPEDEAVRDAYVALNDAVQALAERAYRDPGEPAAWAVLDDHVTVVVLFTSRESAQIAVDRLGGRIAPLYLADPDEVTE